MKTNPLHVALRQLYRGAAPRPDDALSDAQLLERFAANRDEAAFEVLVWRHGRMVWGVCRRLLRQETDVEDAFQATFLLLVRRAGAIDKRAALAGWLYRVAARVALRARADAARRAACERLVPASPATEPSDDTDWRDLRPVLDEEVGRLPEKYRLPVILCYLSGQTTEEAARRIGCPRGTVLSRLAWARERLRIRLVRRGLTVSVGALAVLLPRKGSAAAVPGRLIAGTVTAARWLAAGRAAAPGVVSARAVALMKGVQRTMYLTRMRTMTAMVALAVLGVGVGLWAYRPAEAGSTPTRKIEEPQATAPAAAPLPARPTALGLAGTWVRDANPYRITLRIEGDRLHGAFTGALGDDKEKTTILLDADYSVSKDGTLYGIVTSVELSDPDDEEEAMTLMDEPFSARLRIDDDVLVIKDLKFRTGGQDNTRQDVRLLLGRYKKLPAGARAISDDDAVRGERKPARKPRGSRAVPCPQVAPAPVGAVPSGPLPPPPGPIVPGSTSY